VARPIESERLSLVSLTAEFMRALLAGRRGEAERLLGRRVPGSWPGEDEAFFRRRLQQLEDDTGVLPWLARAVVLRAAPGEAAGHAGFHGPPGVNGPGDAAAVEIGYQIEPEHRGQGYATEVARALCRHAFEQPRIERVIASVSPANEASLAVVRKLGFIAAGSQWDEADGEELVFVLERRERD
jgi:RimJ/RimL family protein N-acetyltransferase